MTKPRFTFILPNTAWFEKRYWHNFPYVEALLTAVLKKAGYEVDIIDANLDNLSEEQLIEKIKERPLEIVGVSALTIEYRDCVHKTFELIKKANPKIITVIGGIYPTLSPDMVTKDTNIDFFVFGEGEIKIIKLLEAIEKGEGFEKIDSLAFRKDDKLVFNPKISAPIEIDSLPEPDYSLFDMERYTNYQQKYSPNFIFKNTPSAVTMTSRGCPHSCTFCCSKKLYANNTRTRTAKNVLKEIDMLIMDYGIKEMVFTDDSLLWPREKALEIFEGFIERKKKGIDLVWKSNNLAINYMDDFILDKMKESGCYKINVSIESGCDATLRRMKKPVNLKKAIETLEIIKTKNFDDVSSNFVIGIPGDTMDDIRETFRFAEEMVDKGLLDYVVFNIALPFPNTELYDICRKNNYLPEDFSFENSGFYGLGKGVINTPEFTSEELQILRAYEWDRINFKTEEKKKKICRMMGITLEELEELRKRTRRSVGINVNFTDKEA